MLKPFRVTTIDDREVPWTPELAEEFSKVRNCVYDSKEVVSIPLQVDYQMYLCHCIEGEETPKMKFIHSLGELNKEKTQEQKEKLLWDFVDYCSDAYDLSEVRKLAEIVQQAKKITYA